MSEETPTSAAAPPTRATYWRRRVLVALAALVALSLVGALAFGAYFYLQVDSIKKSVILDGVGGQGVNLLVMGLDSRLDENGKPLPRSIYDALHSGDQSSGGLNSNVLIFVHIPADGSRAVGISIPRDDYVPLAGCPDGVCHGKIKEAYGLAVDQRSRELAAQHVTGAAAYQQARDAGRQAEIRTVDHFLGVTVNRFAEVTMVAFFQLARVVQPISVCVKEPTVDSFSGADFHRGVQQIDAAQAVAFVRQRRDTRDPSLDFTDLDRERRQQAFIISLLTQLKSANTLLDPSKVLGLVDVVKQNVVISSGLDPTGLAQLADELAGGGLHFFTLPVAGFTMIGGQDVTLVDPARVRATVAQLIDPHARPRAVAPSAAPVTAPSRLSVEAVNASGVVGAARATLTELAAKGYRTGLALTAAVHSTASTVRYPRGERAEAAALQAAFGSAATLVLDPRLAAHHLVLVIGTARSTAAGPGAPRAVAGTGGGRSGPPITALTDIASGGIPCVK